MAHDQRGAYGADDHIVDYILGITFEIWERRGVELIHQYYATDCKIYGLDGITHGSAEMVEATWNTLKAFPDRLLLAENVIWSGNRDDGYYTSHRLLSIATNDGPTVYGPATGVRIRMTNIADCAIEGGVIVEEWLVRDNMTLAKQLGAEPVQAAREMALARTAEHQQWINDEIARVSNADLPAAGEAVSPRGDPEAFARRVLRSCWMGNKALFDTMHAPYSVMHRSPMRHYSGRDDVFAYYESLRDIIGDAHFSIDHVASQPFSDAGVDIAVRWTVAGLHESEVMGVAATGKPLFILGVTHWRCIEDRITAEVTVFDDLAVLSQTLVE